MRVKGGTVTRARRKKMIKLAKGYRGQRSINYRVAKERVWKGWTYAFRDRKQTKRNFRKLWIARINAAARINGLSYSNFMHGLSLMGYTLLVIQEVFLHQLSCLPYGAYVQFLVHDELLLRFVFE